MRKLMFLVTILVIVCGTALAQTQSTRSSRIRLLDRDGEPAANSKTGATAVSAAAQEAVKSYDFTTIDFPGAKDTILHGLNDKGDFVGRYDYDGVTNHGFLFHRNQKEDGSDVGGCFTTIDFPGATATTIPGINNEGQITGGWTDSVGGGHGFLLDEGTFSSFDFPGAVHTAAGGINDRGEIVGGFDFGDITTSIGFLLRHGKFTSFEVPGSFPQSTLAFGINDHGQIVGFFVDSAGLNFHGFLLDRGRFTQIDFPGVGCGTQLFGINDKGQISGKFGCVDPPGGHGFVLSSGKFLVVDFPGAFSTGVRKINSRGEIAGAYSQSKGGVQHGFIATPAEKD